jgi:hypothetical protein
VPQGLGIDNHPAQTWIPHIIIRRHGITVGVVGRKENGRFREEKAAVIDTRFS